MRLRTTTMYNIVLKRLQRNGRQSREEKTTTPEKMHPAYQEIEDHRDYNAENLYLQDALQSKIVPQICSIVSPIIQEVIERRVEYWKQKYKATEKKLQTALQQQKCPTCQKENIMASSINSKKRKCQPNMQVIVASAAASASRKNKVVEDINSYRAEKKYASTNNKVILIPITQQKTNCSALTSNATVKTRNSFESVKKLSEQRSPIKVDQLDRRPLSPSSRQETKFKYVEVVRNHAERRSLHGHTCAECDAFTRFILQSRDSKGNAIFDPKDIVQACSRHRSRFSQGVCTTPEGFWEMSFADSIEKRAMRANNNSDTETTFDNSREMSL